MAEIIHRVGIRAGPDKVFKALSTIDGLAGWWTEDTSGVSEVGKTITFQFRDPKGQIMGEFEIGYSRLGFACFVHRNNFSPASILEK